MVCNREVLISIIAILIIFFLMFFSARFAHSMERRPSITVDQHEDPAEEMQYLRTLLCDYAVKELIEKIHEEKKSKISERRQKWISIGVGTITTFIPLIIVIIKTLHNDCSFTPSSNATLY